MIRLEGKPPTRNGHAEPAERAAVPRRARRFPGQIVLVAAGLMAAAALVVALLGPARPSAQAPTAETTLTPKLIARGQVRPIGQARVGTLVGGVVYQLSVDVGDRVKEQQEIARVRGPNGAEVLTAPWAGMVIGLPVHLGDTLVPGTTVATIGDLTHLQVETTDVDEFLIAHVQRGQAVVLTVDALDQRPFRGYVRTVALQFQKNDSGDDHYPVVIDLADPTSALRPGMTVRVDFAPQQP